MEKLTKSLCILTALALLAACDKDADSGVQIPAAKTNFEVSLPGALETYGVEDPQAAGQITPYYANVTVYLIDAGENAMGYAWTDAEIKARQKRFEQVVEPAAVGVIVNSGGVTLPNYGDHRMVMLASIAATKCEQPIEMDGIEAIDKSWPEYLKVYQMLGGKCE